VSEEKLFEAPVEPRRGSDSSGWLLVVVFVAGGIAGAMIQLGTRVAGRLAGGPAWAGIGGWLILTAGLAGAWFFARGMVVLARGARRGQRMSARLDVVIPPDDPSRFDRGVDRQLETVISGYRASQSLAARVAELEGQLRERALREASPAPAPPPIPAAVRLRARQLSESSFVAGSDALVRVRTAIRLVQDCRQRLDGSSMSGPGTPGAADTSRYEKGGRRVPPPPNGWREASENGGVARPGGREAPSAPLLHDLFQALGAEIGDLSRSARGLGGALDELARTTGRRPAGGRFAPNGPRAMGSPELALSALKCRSLAVELEGGLQRLGAEIRLLSHPAVSRGPEAAERPEKNGSDRSLMAGLRRLEAQLEEVGEHLVRLTRDAEELSRELDRQPERTTL
jgi:hypothetical protein